MPCKCATPTDQYHGYECAVTGGECLFLPPNSKLCAAIFGEGPDAGDWEGREHEPVCRNCEYWLGRYQECEHPDVDDEAYAAPPEHTCDLWVDARPIEPAEQAI